MAWRTYSPGQTPLQTFGRGRVARHDAGPVQEMRLDGVVRFEPCKTHTHAATPAAATARTAIRERQDDKVVIWLERATNARHEHG